MMILATSLENFLNGTIIGSFGSIALFGLVLLVIMGFLVIKLNLPPSFLLIVLGIVGVALFGAFGGIFRIVATIFAVIMGVIIAIMMMQTFNKSKY